MEITAISQMSARSMAPFALCRQSLPHYDLCSACLAVLSPCCSLALCCSSILYSVCASTFPGRPHLPAAIPWTEVNGSPKTTKHNNAIGNGRNLPTAIASDKGRYRNPVYRAHRPAV